MEPIRYFLSPGAFLCDTSRYLVVLDVGRDRYACIPRSRFDPLIPWLSGWPRSDIAGASTSSAAPDTHIAQCAADLVSQGILTTDPLRSKPVRPVSVPLAHAEMRRPAVPVSALLLGAAAFFLACRRAESALARRRFEDVVRAVERRRQRHTSADGEPVLRRAARLRGIFDALRLLYPHPAVCTFDSLALLEFLALDKLFPHWIFGVQPEPFQAHCWVQLGGVLVNDRLERVASFTPIMAV